MNGIHAEDRGFVFGLENVFLKIFSHILVIELLRKKEFYEKISGVC
jgi:hypothetical protein